MLQLNQVFIFIIQYELSPHVISMQHNSGHGRDEPDMWVNTLNVGLCNINAIKKYNIISMLFEWNCANIVKTNLSCDFKFYQLLNIVI